MTADIGGGGDRGPRRRLRHRPGRARAPSGRLPGCCRAGWQVLEEGGTALDAVERACASSRDPESAVPGAAPPSARRASSSSMPGSSTGLPSRSAPSSRSAACRARSRRPARARGPVRRVHGDPAPGSSPSVRASRRGIRMTSCPRASERSGRSGWPAGPELGRDAVRPRHGRRDRSGPHRRSGHRHLHGWDAVQAGRPVGDSPVVGAGLYADNATGAASRSEHGERIVPVVLSKTTTDLIGSGLDPQTAAERALAILEGVKGRGGLITLEQTRPGRDRLEHPRDGVRASDRRARGTSGRR